MQHSNPRRDDNPLKQIGECFNTIGWHKRLCDLQEHEVLGIIAVIQKMRDLTDDYTEQGILEFEQSVTSFDELNDPIPF